MSACGPPVEEPISSTRGVTVERAQHDCSGLRHARRNVGRLEMSLAVEPGLDVSLESFGSAAEAVLQPLLLPMFAS